MLSQLDHIIFPDRCEVYEIVPSQRYFYPIYKNGTSSLAVANITKKWKIYLNEQIKRIPSIDVVLRDPYKRYVSGINTYIQFVCRENPNLDPTTIQWFAEQYLFLNRHYATQFIWLVNLSRYLSTQTVLNFSGMETIQEITDLNMKPVGVDAVTEEFVKSLNFDKDNMFQRVDYVLMTHCINKSLTFQEVVEYIKKYDSAAFDAVVGKTIKVINPLYVLSKN